jgi:serine/threonine-protein kinase HipA
MSDNVSFFDIHRLMPNGTELLLGAFAVSHSSNGRINKQQFMYEADYINHPLATEISPLLPLSNSGVQSYPSDGHSFVGFIDDMLPDDWGKKVIARRIKKRHVTNLMALDFIGHSSSIGACKVTQDGEYPNWSLGLELTKANRIIEALYTGDIDKLSQQELEYTMLVQGGSAVGGARPKMLVKDLDGNPCIIKPNEDNDKQDVAALEWASLEVCRLAGLKTAEASIYILYESIKSLLIKRFDTTHSGGRRQLVSINSLLKDQNSQCDAMYYSYEDIANCIKKYSWNVKGDLKQLFGAMLINQALGNSDDHLRNTSFISSDKGWELSPIYDVLPHWPINSEHACTFDRSVYLPTLNNAINTGQKLGLNKSDSLAVKSNVQHGLSKWESLVRAQGINDIDIINIPVATQN